MVTAVAVLLLLFFVGSAHNSAPETAIVVDSAEETIAEEVKTAEVTNEEINVSENETSEIPDFLESFNEDELEEEFGDVQTGIDLLDNPLQ